MLKNFIRKSVGFVIILLLIGLSISSNISGTVNNESTKVVPANSPLKDYTLGFWKFDECSGNTAYDESGHDFDGLINGPTWISYGSGCALDFDGINDFIGLDDYSENLGMNKTDDIIFSVYFNSSSTNDGLILSMSDSWNKQNPELSIQLCSNGSILFRVWTLYCGLHAYTDKTYNNGKWHFLKIVYHGSTADPKLEIHIDNKLIKEKEDWLCPIEADEFRRAKIGRRAVDATMHFDGALDRLKIVGLG